MKTWQKGALTTILFAVPAFIIQKQIWPPASMGIEPTSSQLPFLIFLAIAEALAFGLAITVLILGLPFVNKTPKKERKRSLWNLIAIVWIMGNWWSHDALHAHIGMDLQKLIYIEYGYHVTLMIAGVILASNFFYYKTSK